MPLLFDGVGEMLRDLADEGYLLAVATGKSRRGLEYALDQTASAASSTPRARWTRRSRSLIPQMLLDILDELGVRPRDAVMIGDTTYDLEMARSARTAAVGVCSGSPRPRGAAGLRTRSPAWNSVVELGPGWRSGPAAVRRLVAP